MVGIVKVDTLQNNAGTSSVDMDYVVNGTAKAWAEIAAGGASIPDSFNFSSIDDDGTGEYGLNYTSAMGSVNYSANATMTFGHVSGGNNLRLVRVESKATSSVEIDSAYISSSIFTSYDIETNANVTVHGDLA